jgi:DNA-directed RNA polymerase subunit K/omega
MPPKKQVTYGSEDEDSVVDSVNSEDEGDGDDIDDYTEDQDDELELEEEDGDNTSDAMGETVEYADEDDEDGAEQERTEIQIMQPNDDNDSLPDDLNDLDEEDYNNHLRKFGDVAHREHVSRFHSELKAISPEEMQALCTVVRDAQGNIVDPLHTTMPRLTKYERTRVLSERACQIDRGAPPFIALPDSIIQAHTIAEYEFNAGLLPFIISRPMSGGGMEYWKLSDLENI